MTGFYMMATLAFNELIVYQIMESSAYNMFLQLFRVSGLYKLFQFFLRTSRLNVNIRDGARRKNSQKISFSHLKTTKTKANIWYLIHGLQKLRFSDNLRGDGAEVN